MGGESFLGFKDMYDGCFFKNYVDCSFLRSRGNGTIINRGLKQLIEWVLLYLLIAGSETILHMRLCHLYTKAFDPSHTVNSSA